MTPQRECFTTEGEKEETAKTAEPVYFCSRNLHKSHMLLGKKYTISDH